MRRLLALGLLALAGPAGAQISATLPVTCNPNAPGDCTRATPVVNPDGTNISGGGGGGGGSVPTGPAGSPNAAVVSVQGISGGTPQSITAAPIGSNGSTAPTSSLQTGGQYASATALPAMTVGNLVPTQTDLYGNIRVMPILAGNAPNDSTTSFGYFIDRGSNDTSAANGKRALATIGHVSDGTNIFYERGNATGVFMQGGVASATVASPNPVIIGAKYNSTPPTFSNGQVATLQVDPNGNLSINNATLPPGAATATGVAAVVTALPTKDTNGDLRVPTVTITAFYVSLAATTSTELLAASTTRIGYQLQCTGTAAVGISDTHATLTKAQPDTTSSGGVDSVIPAGNVPMYIPSYVSTAGVTAYTGTAQACWGKSYARQ